MGNTSTQAATRTSTTPLSDEEKALVKQQGELLGLQIKDYELQSAALAEAYPLIKNLIAAQATTATAEAQVAMRQLAGSLRTIGIQEDAYQSAAASLQETVAPTQGRDELTALDSASRGRKQQLEQAGALVNEASGWVQQAQQNLASDPNNPQLQQVLQQVSSAVQEREAQRQALIGADTRASAADQERRSELQPSGGATTPTTLAALSTPGELAPQTQPGTMEALSTPGTMEALSTPGSLGAVSESQLDLEPLTEQEKSYLNEIYGAASEEGMRALTQAGNDAAAARGFRLSDSPVGNAYLDEASQFQANLSANKAGQALTLGREGRALREDTRRFQADQEVERFKTNEAVRQFQEQAVQNRWTAEETARQFQEQAIQGRFGATEQARQFQEQSNLARYGATESTRQFQEQATESRGAFTEAVRQFQEGLKQQTFQNRLMLSGSAPAGVNTNSGAAASTQATQGLTSGSGTNLSQALSQYFAALGQRTGGSNTSSTGDRQPSLAESVPIFGLFSTARVKKDIVPYDRDEYDVALQKLKDTPVTRWKYTWEGDDVPVHTGPILELSPEDIKRDSWHLDLLSYTGLTHAGLKALDRKVERLAEVLGAE